MRVRPVLAALPLLVLAACGTESGPADPSRTEAGASTVETTTAEVTESAEVTDPAESDSSETTDGETPALPTDETGAAPTGEADPASTAIADPPADPATLPTISEGAAFGEKPVLEFPAGEAPAGLQRQTLIEGDGAEVPAGAMLVANYYGAVWGSADAFDNSFDRGEPTAFAIGVGAVVNGWDVGLVGTKIGDRVLLSLPPSDGYGAMGNQNAGIGGTDTIVFVVDIVDAITTESVDLTAATAESDGTDVGVLVEGDLGAKPTVTLTEDAEAPTGEPVIEVIARGVGEKVDEAKTQVMHLVAVPFDGSPSGGSTWDDGAPTSAPYSQIPTLAGLVGLEIGSRVVLLQPGTEANEETGTQETPAFAYVFDILGQY